MARLTSANTRPTIRGCTPRGGTPIHLLRRVRTWPLYPFIAAVLPIVILWEANRAELVPAGDVLPPIGLALVGAAIVLALAWLGYRDRHRAAVAASVVVVLFFTYG